MEYLENKFFLLAFTFGVFFLSRVLQKKTGWVVLNPILLTIAVLILFLKFTGISYETYNEGGHLIEFWLKPAVVALGVPLYLQLEMIKKQLLPIVISQLAGCLVGLVAVVVIAKLLGATPEIICSLAPKSVTTPIAMEVSKATGGIPSLTAAGGGGGRCCGGSRSVRGGVRFQGTSGRSCGESYCARSFYGYGYSCGRYFYSNGNQWEIWSIR